MPKAQHVTASLRGTHTVMRIQGGAIVEAIAFFDIIELTDFWTRIKPE
jgi:hypothetical protein